MPIAVTCEICGKKHKLNDSLAGRSISCKGCGAALDVPGDDDLADDDAPPRSSATLRARGGKAPRRGKPDYQASVSPKALIGVGGVLVVVLVIAAVVANSGGSTPPAPVAQGEGAPPSPFGGGGATPNPFGAPASTPDVAPPAAASTAAPGTAATSASPAQSAAPGQSAAPAAPTTTADPPGAKVAAAAPAANLAVKPAIEAPAAPIWELSADPPPAEWTLTEVAKNLNIKVLGDPEHLTYPSTPSPFVLVGRKSGESDAIEVWSLATGQQTAQLERPLPNTDQFALSPDGKHLAFTARGATDRQRVQVLECDGGKIVNELAVDDVGGWVKLLEFGPNATIVTLSTSKQPDGKFLDRLRAIDFVTGEMVWELANPRMIHERYAALSPGRRYLASTPLSPRGLTVIDLTTGEIAGQKALPEADDFGQSLTPETLAFAPDGAQLAVMQQSLTGTQISSYALEGGKLSLERVLPGRLNDTHPASVVYKGPRLEWLSDGSGWMLGGVALLDAESGKNVWNAKPEYDKQYKSLHNFFVRRLVPGGFILVDGPRKATRLKFVPIDLPEIREWLAKMEEDEDAVVAPGKTVSVSVQVGALRGGDPQSTQSALVETISKRLALDGVTVTPGQPVVLKVEYRESAGATLSEGPRRPPSGVSTPSAGGGRTVDATKAQLEFTLGPAEGKAVYWSDTLDVDPQFLILRGDVSAQGARNAMFDQLLARLYGVPFPYYLTKAKRGPALPQTYVVPYNKL